MVIDTTEVEETQTPEGDQHGDDDQSESGRGRALAKASIRLPGIRTMFTTTAAIIPANLSWDAWRESFVGASNVGDMSKWWRGDLLRFAMDNEKYGQKYSQFCEGENYGSLKNLMSICGKFPPEKRREGLTFTHHVAAAPLMPDHDDVADEILAQAEKENWSVADVRAAVREYLEGPRQDDDDEPAAPRATVRAVPTEPAEMVGVKPIPLGDIEAGAEYYECPASTCEPYGFLEPVIHCVDCGAHYSAELESCPHCPEEGAAGGTTGEDYGASEDTPVAVSGTVITPFDQGIGTDDDDDTDTGGATLNRLLAASPVLTVLDPKITGREIVASGDLNRTRAVALHAWLGQVIATFPGGAATNGRPFTPVPKPGEKKRGRKPKRTTATDD